MKDSNKIDVIIDHKKSMTFFVFAGIIVSLLTFIGVVIFEDMIAGNMTMSVDPNMVYNYKYIEIADNENFEFASDELNVEVDLNQSITYTSISIDEIILSEGLYEHASSEYLAYSLYVKNSGIEKVSINYYMRITEIYQLMDEKIRILIIEDDEMKAMYQRADQAGDESDLPDYNELPLGIEFLSQHIIFRDIIIDLEPDAYKSFRVIVWLEEQDPDMTDEYLEGLMKLQMNFSIAEGYSTGSNQNILLSSSHEKIWFSLSQICNVQFSINYGAKDYS